MTKQWERRTVLFAALASAAVLGAGEARPVEAAGAKLLASTESDAESASGKLGSIHDEDVLLFDSGPASWIGHQSWRILVGDADGDGRFDDEPSEVDALAVALDAPARPTAFDLLVSFSADRSFPSGAKARDGDVIRLGPGGTFTVFVSEDQFAAATSTSSIDVDAFAIAPDGTLYFSFAEDETTTAAHLVAENGGSETLDEACVFQIRPSDSQAHLYLSPASFLAMVNHAIGSSLTTVGDVQGLDFDPDVPGALLFAVSSKSRGVEGTVFTTANGGSVAVVGGVEMRGDSMGFTEEETLDAIAVVADAARPLSIRAAETSVSVSASEYAEFAISGGTPGGVVIVLAAPAVFPVATPLPDPRLGGTGILYVDTSSALFRSSLRNRKFRTVLDAAGCGAIRFPTAGSPAGITRVVQAVDLSTFEASEAVAVETLP